MKLDELHNAADNASALLKSLANPQRLRILCLIMEQERPVGELADALDMQQSAVSQHLALLRREGLLKARRDGQTVYYQLTGSNIAPLLDVLAGMFCQPKKRTRG